MCKRYLYLENISSISTKYYFFILNIDDVEINIDYYDSNDNTKKRTDRLH
jgi:hypothetical protein